MKKFALSMLAVALLLTLVCGSALAVTGDMTTRAVKAYADPEMKNCIGTIPKFTSLLVRASGSYADVYVNGVRCYISASALTKGEYDYAFVGTAVLKEGAAVYQRPSASAAKVINGKNRKVLVYAATDGYALIRTKVGGVFGFVSASNLAKLSGN